MCQFDEEGLKLRRQNRLKWRVYLSKVIIIVHGYQKVHDMHHYTVAILQGPNYAWHMDGYTKLTPFGFHIHGCVDGYSNVNICYYNQPIVMI